MIGEPVSLEGSLLRRGLAIGVCVLFGVALLGTLAIDTIWPAPKKKPIGAEAVEQQQRIAAANLWDGSSARLFESELQQRSRVRELVTNSYGYFLYRHLGLVRPSILVGEDGWLFLKNRARLEHATPRTPAVIGCALAAMERALALTGIEVVSVCVPRKALLHRDRLPRGVRLQGDLEAQVAEELRVRGVTGPDLLEVFATNNTGRESSIEAQRALYMVTDSHWAPRAEYLAARATSVAAGLRVPRERRRGTFLVKPNGPIGRDLLHYAGLTLTEELEAYLRERPAESWQLVSKQGKPLSLHLAGPDARIVVCGTSFTARRQFPNFLAHFLGEPVHNAATLGGDPTDQLWKLLAADHRPEVVIMEYPSHSLFHPLILRNAGNVYATLEYPQLPVVTSAAALPLQEQFRGQPIESDNYQIPLAATPMDVVHSGDGVLAWRIRGESRGPGMLLRGGVLPALLRLPWTRGDQEVLMPIVGEGPAAGVNAFALKSVRGNKMRGNAQIDSVELVIMASEERSIDCALGETGQVDNDWFQDLKLPAGELLPVLPVLDFALEFDEGDKHVLTLEIWEEGDGVQPSLKQRVAQVPKQARVVFNVSAFSNKSVRAIRIRSRRGSGAATVSHPRILGGAQR